MLKQIINAKILTPQVCSYCFANIMSPATVFSH